MIDHGGGVLTRYAHLSSIDVKPGATIAAAVRLGRVGATGRATGPHLHFEVRLDDRPVDPSMALKVAALQRTDPGAAKLAAWTLTPEAMAKQVDRHGPPRAKRPAAKCPAARRADPRPQPVVTGFEDVLAAIAAPLPDAAGAWTTAQHLITAPRRSPRRSTATRAQAAGHPVTIGAIVKRRFCAPARCATTRRCPAARRRRALADAVASVAAAVERFRTHAGPLAPAPGLRLAAAPPITSGCTPSTSPITCAPSAARERRPARAGALAVDPAVEALAALLAQRAGGHHLPQQLGRLEVAAQRVGQVLGDAQAHVEPDQVGQPSGPSGRSPGFIAVSTSSTEATPLSTMRIASMPSAMPSRLDAKPGLSLTVIGVLPHAVARSTAVATALGSLPP
jgi:hypothetical protein